MVNCLKWENGLRFMNLNDEKLEFIAKEKEYYIPTGMSTLTVWDFIFTSFLFEERSEIEYHL